MTIESRATRVLALATLALAIALPGATPLPAQRHNTVSFEEGEEGWYPLFDGSSLQGWTVVGDTEWRVEGGELVADSGGTSLLLSEEPFSDLEVKVDFLAAPGANSGVFLRVTGRSLAAALQTYEINIAPPANAFPTGSVMHVHTEPGSPPRFTAAAKAEGAGESDQWRTLHIVAVGGRITVTLDGEPMARLEDPEPVAEGFLGLQHNQGRVAFRNVKVRRLRL